jgi:hypothetical protein
MLDDLLRELGAEDLPFSSCDGVVDLDGCPDDGDLFDWDLELPEAPLSSASPPSDAVLREVEPRGAEQAEQERLAVRSLTRDEVCCFFFFFLLWLLC